MSVESAGKTGVVESCRRFLKDLGQAIKLVSLYKATHPVPVSAIQRVRQDLHDLFAESGWASASFSAPGGRWLANETVVADSAQAFELLAIAFRIHALQSVTFKPEVRLYELQAFCELGATPPNQAYESDAGDFLKERGVRQILVNVEEYVRARRVKAPASSLIQNPLARPAGGPPAAATPGVGPPQGQGFGSFIKSLVDKAISDPGERAQLYTEAVRLVESALSRHVAEATSRLVRDKQVVLNERIRAENVISRVAEGKVIVDQEGRVLMMDPAAEEIAGRPLSEVAGRPILESLGTGEKIVALSQDLIIPENRPVSDEVKTAGDESVRDALRQSLALVQDEQGRLVGTYGELPAAAKFREALRMQEEFVANVTHDLKAPLTSICSALELLTERLGRGLGEEESGFLEICRRNSETLKDMIGEILDFSKLRSGKLGVKPKPVALSAVIQESIESLRPWAQSRKLALMAGELETAAALPPVLADPPRAVQVLNNLISNAIKCTPECGSIVVRAGAGSGENAGMAVVSVADTGCGIPEPDQKRLFEKFAQVSSDGRRREGTGLGLAIVRELVAGHGGKVWLKSEVGKGSVFYFTLPFAPKPDKREE